MREKIAVTGELLNVLRSQQGPVELVSEDGTSLGSFLPRLLPADLDPPGGWPTDAELTQLHESGKTYTTEQVIAHLRSLD